MGLPGADLNQEKNSKKKKSINKRIKNFDFWIFVLVSNLPQDSLHSPLLRALKNYLLYIKIIFKRVLG